MATERIVLMQCDARKSCNRPRRCAERANDSVVAETERSREARQGAAQTAAKEVALEARCGRQVSMKMGGRPGVAEKPTVLIVAIQPQRRCTQRPTASHHESPDTSLSEGSEPDEDVGFVVVVVVTTTTAPSVLRRFCSCCFCWGNECVSSLGALLMFLLLLLFLLFFHFFPPFVVVEETPTAVSLLLELPLLLSSLMLGG